MGLISNIWLPKWLILNSWSERLIGGAAEKAWAIVVRCRDGESITHNVMVSTSPSVHLMRLHSCLTNTNSGTPTILFRHAHAAESIQAWGRSRCKHLHNFIVLLTSWGNDRDICSLNMPLYITMDEFELALSVCCQKLKTWRSARQLTDIIILLFDLFGRIGWFTCKNHARLAEIFNDLHETVPIWKAAYGEHIPRKRIILTNSKQHVNGQGRRNREASYLGCIIAAVVVDPFCDELAMSIMPRERKQKLFGKIIL